MKVNKGHQMICHPGSLIHLFVSLDSWFYLSNQRKLITRSFGLIFYELWICFIFIMPSLGLLGPFWALKSIFYWAKVDLDCGLKLMWNGAKYLKKVAENHWRKVHLLFHHNASKSSVWICLSLILESQRRSVCFVMEYRCLAKHKKSIGYSSSECILEFDTRKQNASSNGPPEFSQTFRKPKCCFSFPKSRAFKN